MHELKPFRNRDATSSGDQSYNRKEEKQMQKLLVGMQQKHPEPVNRSKNFLNSCRYHLQYFVNFTEE